MKILKITVGFNRSPEQTESETENLLVAFFHIVLFFWLYYFWVLFHENWVNSAIICLIYQKITKQIIIWSQITDVKNVLIQNLIIYLFIRDFTSNFLLQNRFFSIFRVSLKKTSSLRVPVEISYKFSYK